MRKQKKQIDPEDDEDECGDGEMSIDYPLIEYKDDDGPDDYWGD